MRKIMFAIMALAFTAYSTCSNASQYVAGIFNGNNSNTYQVQQNTKAPLILEKFQKGKQLMAYHYSHSSHASHSSHYSHSSHVSHYSSRW